MPRRGDDAAELTVESIRAVKNVPVPLSATQVGRSAPIAARQLLQNSPALGNRNSDTPKFVQSEFGNECAQNLIRDSVGLQ